jgi:hypothetical protein
MSEDFRARKMEQTTDPNPIPAHCRNRHHRQKVGTWAFLTAGAGSLIWFLIRVIPKPSRAAYPCQRAAAPFASAFVIWLMAVLGAKWALVHRREFARQRRLVAAFACTVGLIVCGGMALRSLPASLSHAGNPPHGPIGVAKGIHPGRVAWVHSPDATSWAGWNSPATDPWWGSNHTDLAVVENMMSQGIRDVAGESSEAAAWSAIFANFNTTHGRGQRGYQSGEKVAIKINLTTCNGGSDCNLSTHEKTANTNRIDNSPQMLLALLRHLVYTAGVPQTNISIGDPTALFPGFLYRPLHTEFPDVNYFEVMGGSGRTQVAFSNVPFYWSTAAANGKVQDYVPVPFAQADYLINFAILKGHSSGITLCGKNLYGALKRCPSGSLYGQVTPDYYVTHLSLPNAEWSPGLGHYRSIVDLMGSKNLGGKTLLCLVDGLFGGYYWDSHPYAMKMPPFGDGTNGDWPSSLLVSQDPVAIDSVGYDLLLTEWPAVVNNGVGSANSLQGGAEDYLHEEALADAPPSGTSYDPDHAGVRMASLGVHEHWNNATNRQYSRNLGQTNGIELVYTKLSKTGPRLSLSQSVSGVAVSWPSSYTGYRLQSTTTLAPSTAWSDVTNVPAWIQAQNVVSNDVSGTVRVYRLTK